MTTNSIFPDRAEAWLRSSHGRDIFELDCRHYDLLMRYTHTSSRLALWWLRRKIVRIRIDTLYEEVDLREEWQCRSAQARSPYDVLGFQLASVLDEDIQGPLRQILHAQSPWERELAQWREGDRYEAVLGGLIRMCHLGVPPRTQKDIYRWREFADFHPELPFCGYEFITVRELVHRIIAIDREILAGLGATGSVVPHGSLSEGETPSTP